MADATQADMALQDQRWGFLAKNHAGGQAADGDYLMIALTGRGPNQPAATIRGSAHLTKLTA